MRSLELFVGAGGLAIGTANAGFSHDIMIEWDRNACATLRRNKLRRVRHVRNWQVYEGDVAKYDFRLHRGQIEIVSGGPPCQPFSLGGKHRGRADRRNLFPEAVRAVRETLPLAFMFENVKGLLRRNFANYFSYILHQLRFPTITSRGDEEWRDHLTRLEKVYTGGRFHDVHYRVVHRLLNAADYGVPQRRERVFIVGLRSDLAMEFGFPESTHEEDALIHDKWVSGEYFDRHEIPRARRTPIPATIQERARQLEFMGSRGLLRPWQTVRDAINDLPRIRAGEAHESVLNHYLNPGARTYPGHTGSPYDEPAKALKAGDHGVPGGENTLRLDDGSIRYFSVRECARIQTFPDQWEFVGSWTETMRQLGNAVPVKLAEVVARKLRATLVAPVLKRIAQARGAGGAGLVEPDTRLARGDRFSNG